MCIGPTNFVLYNERNGGKMDTRNNLLQVLEVRVKRLSDLLEGAAPTHLICNEVALIVESTKKLNPEFMQPKWNSNYYNTERNNNDQAEIQVRCATG